MATVNHWIVAFRLKTLPVAFSSILVGTSLASTYVQIDPQIAVLTLLTAVLLQILSNLANDYGDAVSGVDSDQRKGPERMVQSGKITKNTMRYALVVFILLSLTSGLTLLYLTFPGNWINAFIFLVIGLTAIVAAIRYTIGKNPYGYAGFGDLAVFLFFGLVGVVGTCYLQTHSIAWINLLPASTLGLLAVGVLNINNIRDIESDTQSGKRSIPVRIGKEKATVYHLFLLIIGLLCSVYFTMLKPLAWTNFLFLLIIPLLFSNIQAVRTKDGIQLNPSLRQMALTTLLFSVLFAVSQLIS